MITNPYNISAKQWAKGIRERKFSCQELVESCIKIILKNDELLQSWEYFAQDTVMSAARDIDERIKNGKTTGNLAGVPVGVKDIFNTKDMPTAMGSPIWKGFTPGNDARIVARMRMRDMIIMGKTVTAEFAVHAPNKTRNPYNIDYSPGTSSSGSAAAVAAGMVPIALGTQTAGSIVRPASYCGVFGFKPSFGLLPRTGMLKTTDSLDTVGFFTRYAEDLKAFLDEIIVTGENWPISYETISKKSSREKGNRPWRIAVAKTHMWGYVENYVKDAFESLINKIAKDRDFDLIELALPVEFEESHKIHSTIYDKTLSYYFKEEFKDKDLISPIMYKIISHGKNITLDEYKEALAKQAKLRMRLEGILSNQRIDAIITNSTSSHAPKFKEDDIPDNALIWTLTASPVISMPVFMSPAGLPFGVQLISKRFHDYLLTELAEDLVEMGHIKEPRPVDVIEMNKNNIAEFRCVDSLELKS